MKLKPNLNSLDGLSDEIKALYTQNSNGSYDLQIEGMVPKAKLDEFRNTNINLNQTKEELEQRLNELATKYDGVDADKAKEALDIMNKLREQKLIEEGKVEELIQARVAEMKRGFSTREQELLKDLESQKSSLADMTGKYSSLFIGNQIFDAMGNVARPHATSRDLITDLAMRTWKLGEDGAPVAMDGENPLYSADDASKPLDMVEWCNQLVQERPYLFESTNGARQQGGGGQHQGGQKFISDGDQAAFESNIEKIASGEVVVR